MDPYQLWKDDYRNEVEAVLAERRRAREAGLDAEQTAPEEFQGRLVDLVIPPAGVHAEAMALKDRLAAAEQEKLELQLKLAAALDAAGRERSRRERIKDAAAKLAFDARGHQADRAAAQERVRVAELRASEAVSAAESRIRALQAEAERSAFRAESEERTAAARLQSMREIQARVDKLLIEKDSDAAEVTGLRRRLDAAASRSDEAERRELEVERRLKEALAIRDLTGDGQKNLDLARRLNEALEALKVANERAEMAPLETQALVQRAKFAEEQARREAERAVKESAAAREALEESRRSEARAVALATQAEFLKAQATEEVERLRFELAKKPIFDPDFGGGKEIASERREVERLRAEAEKSLEESRRLESEFSARVASAIAEERVQTDLQRMIASQSLEKARSLEKESMQRLEDAERRISEEAARLLAQAQTQTDASMHVSSAPDSSETLSRAEKAEAELADSRRSEAEATKRIQDLVRTLSDYRAKMKELSAKLNERLAGEKKIAETAVAEALRREAELKAHLDSMAGGNSAAIEEERAKLKAEFEEMRAQLETKVDEERRQLQTRWKEQAELLEKLRQARDRKPESGA